MTKHFGLNFKAYLLDRGIGENEYFKFLECSDEDIEQTRIEQDVEFLPRIYREFLLTMGYGAGTFLLGSAYTCNKLLDMKDAAKGIMELGNAQENLPDDAFVFFMHQGYTFCYFRTTNQDDDPPVFLYIEGKPTSTKQNDHLSTWFYEGADEQANLWRKS